MEDIVSFIIIFCSFYLIQLFISSFTPYSKIIEKLVGDDDANKVLTLIAFIATVIFVTNVPISYSDNSESPSASSCRYCD